MVYTVEEGTLLSVLEKYCLREWNKARQRETNAENVFTFAEKVKMVYKSNVPIVKSRIKPEEFFLNKYKSQNNFFKASIRAWKQVVRKG